jgi:hypothetical protein
MEKFKETFYPTMGAVTGFGCGILLVIFVAKIISWF